MVRQIHSNSADFYPVLAFPFAEDENFTTVQDMFKFPLTYLDLMFDVEKFSKFQQDKDCIKFTLAEQSIKSY